MKFQVWNSFLFSALTTTCIQAFSHIPSSTSSSSSSNDYHNRLRPNENALLEPNYSVLGQYSAKTWNGRNCGLKFRSPFDSMQLKASVEKSGDDVVHLNDRDQREEVNEQNNCSVLNLKISAYYVLTILCVGSSGKK